MGRDLSFLEVPLGPGVTNRTDQPREKPGCAERRPGALTLSEDDRRVLAVWAADCAEQLRDEAWLVGWGRLPMIWAIRKRRTSVTATAREPVDAGPT